MALGSLQVLSLLMATMGAVLMEESGSGSLQRRYSEATLASDYSRTMDHVLKKNFVEWLLARRERKSDDIAEFKREAESQKSAANGENVEPGAQKSQNFLEWIWKKMENQSFPALEGSEDLREFLDREFVAWLMSGELCRATTA